MKFIDRVYVLVFLSLFAYTSWSAEIIVPIGIGTLSSAIANAANGDALVLQDGGYSGAATVDKSLTIRAANRGTAAVIIDDMTIEGAGIIVTIQGLKFSAELVLKQADAIRILENHWVKNGIYANAYLTSQGDGSLVVIGNRIDTGTIQGVGSENAYFAGNILSNTIYTNVSVWFVGNEITAPITAIQATGEANVRVIGNRIVCKNSSTIHCVKVNSSFSLIANNIVEILDPDSYEGFQYSQYGIDATGSYATVINNVIRGTPTDLLSSRTGSAIRVTLGGRVAGNIILDYVSAAPDIIDHSDGTEVTHNLCFNNSVDCPVGEGNLNAAPQFVDLVDYRLTVNSPAIDTGPPDYDFADLDRTRNDMGAYGGTWSIGQYDVQRAPYSLAPYVYPFSTGVSGGVLDMQALGVARMR